MQAGAMLQNQATKQQQQQLKKNYEMGQSESTNQKPGCPRHLCLGFS